MNTILSRFYDVSELFDDDERLIAVAIKEFCQVSDTKCSIYKDLLNGKHKKWIDHIEEVSHLITRDWLNARSWVLDNGHDLVFIKGDMDMIEYMCTGEDDASR